jgi:mycothiol synthase
VGDYRVQAKHHVGQPDIAEISDLLTTVAAADDHRPLSEHKWLDLARGGRDGFVGLLAHEVDDAVLVGYAQLTREHDSWGLEIVVHPAHRGEFEHLGTTLLAAAVDQVRRHGGGGIRYWTAKPTARHDANAAALGFVVDRDLLQLRTPLPLPSSEVRRPATALAVRAFRPGSDEAAWLKVNNRAFSDHPEQGGWDLATLLEREGQPWFDPTGFLLCEDSGRLAGSCWTKVHRDVDPALGEIYVISVDPAFHHRGLGRSLTVAGFDHLASLGLTVGMLYVDSANEAAVNLYRSLGLTPDHVDRSYVLDVPHRPSAEKRT